MPLTVVSVKYSETQLLDFYERVPDRELPAGCVSFGMDAMHNAMRLVLRRVDDEPCRSVPPELADPVGALEVGSMRTWSSSVRGAGPRHVQPLT